MREESTLALVVTTKASMTGAISHTGQPNHQRHGTFTYIDITTPACRTTTTYGISGFAVTHESRPKAVSLRAFLRRSLSRLVSITGYGIETGGTGSLTATRVRSPWLKSPRPCGQTSHREIALCRATRARCAYMVTRFRRIGWCRNPRRRRSQISYVPTNGYGKIAGKRRGQVVPHADVP